MPRGTRSLPMPLLMIIGGATVGAIAISLMLEFLLRLIAWFRTTFLVEEIRRADLLADEYQDYIRRVEDWSKPMFTYHPIGLRLFNNDNPIPGRVTNNSLGFRCGEFTGPDPSELRVILLGGSAAWGSGARSNDTTIAGHLERLLNHDRALLGNRKRARCYNLAQINGYQTQDILSLTFFGQQIAPDVVISFTGWNELVALETMRRELLERYGVFYMSEMEGWEPVNVAGNTTAFLRKALRLWGSDRSALVRSLLALRPHPPHQATPIADMIAVGSRIFVRHLELLHMLTTAFDATHLQFLQPYLYRKQHPTPAEENIMELYDQLRPVHGGRATGAHLRAHNAYADLLTTIGSNPERFGPVIDLCDLFRDTQETMFYTLVHLTDTGYERVAQRMAEAIRSHHKL